MESNLCIEKTWRSDTHVDSFPRDSAARGNLKAELQILKLTLKVFPGADPYFFSVNLSKI